MELGEMDKHTNAVLFLGVREGILIRGIAGFGQNMSVET